ncbi:enoyl-CoA hydratase-related protein [Gammaproteobacteria bacterium]|nr:enoyl-CoA hydratase-related protein [Gammaproteobacteria bacterium]
MSDTPYEHLIVEIKNGVATITINRPEVLNSFNGQTCEELIMAFTRTGWDQEVGVIVLTGAGDRAFCAGGDQSDKAGAYAGARGTVGMPVEEVQSLIRDVPKPVIARVRGYAIGGGNVLAALCDLTIASENAIFGQVGPRMGSVDPGFGTAYLARIIGEKKAREFWYLCRRYTAQEALDMGLVNTVVPDEQLDDEVDRWTSEIVERSPTAIAIAKRSFNADSENIRGIGGLGMQALALYYGTEESKEGGRAQKEKRRPEFRKMLK